MQGSPRKRNLKPRLPPKPRKSEASKPDYPASSANTDLQRCRISTQHSIPHSVPQTHIRKNVPSGKKTLENKPLQKPKPCTKSYSGIRKKLTGRTPTDLTRTEIKGRDDRPCSFHISIAHNNLSYHILNFLKLPYFFKFSIVSPYTIPAFNHLMPILHLFLILMT